MFDNVITAEQDLLLGFIEATCPWRMARSVYDPEVIALVIQVPVGYDDPLNIPNIKACVFELLHDKIK